MVLGEMVMETGQFGMESICKPKEGRSLESQLQEAISNIHAEIVDYEVDELVEEDDQSIPATPDVANFSYTVENGQIYYRENSRMKPVELSVTGENRVKEMIAIRDCVKELIDYQTEDYPDEIIRLQQKKLNTLYDEFQKKYGLFNSRGNSMVFSEDNSLGTDIHGNITRIDNALNGLEDKQAGCRDKLSEIKAQYQNAKKEVQKPFSREEELREKSERLEELNALLSLDEKDSSLLEMDNEPSKPVAEEREATGLER